MKPIPPAKEGFLFQTLISPPLRSPLGTLGAKPSLPALIAIHILLTETNMYLLDETNIFFPSVFCFEFLILLKLTQTDPVYT